MKNRIVPSVVIFDWAGVFCSPGEPFSHKGLQKKLRLSPDEIGARVRPLQDKYYRGYISSKQFWSGIITYFKIKNISIKELSRAYLSSYQIYPEMFVLLQKLEPNYTLILLSNLTDEMMKDIIKKYSLKKYFHHMIFSNTAGHLKPEPDIFDLAIKKVGAKPGEVVFIDDSKTNIKAAKKLGFAVIHFKTPKQCQRELKKLGIR